MILKSILYFDIKSYLLVSVFEKSPRPSLVSLPGIAASIRPCFA